MERRRYKNLMLAPGCVRVTGGGNFCKALLQSAFLKSKYSLRLNHYLAVVLVLLLVAGRAAALPEGKFITVTKDTAICWADSDGCFNYILQANEARTANVLCRATGKKLRAGGTYFHTPSDITKDPAAAANEEFAQLVVKEKSSLEAFIERQPGWSFYLFGLVLGLIGLRLYRWTKRRFHKET